jgi:hypothetical protein
MYRRFIPLRRRVVPRAIGHGDVRLRLRPHGGHNHIHEVVVLNVERAHNSRSHRDWWIGDYRLSQLIATEPGYTTNRELRVPVKIKDVLWVWHSWSQVNSD